MTQHAFIVGAQRCSTTYLYKLLEESTEICMATPMRPEPKYFLDMKQVLLGKDYYLHTFFQQPCKKLLVEKSTSYIESKQAAERIYNYFPDAKIVILLRNPVQRAISNYRFSRENGIETLEFAEAIKQEGQRNDEYETGTFSVSPFAYMRRGQYIDYIAYYQSYFPKDQIKILVKEQFISSQGVFDDLCDFLGIGTFRPRGLKKTINASDAADPILSTTLQRQLQEYFAPYNRRLEKEFDLDLSCWDEEL